MKKKTLFLAFMMLLGILSGCSAPREYDPIAATTLPVYEFTSRLCEGTGLNVTRLVTESVSCLHDYSLNVSQVRSAEAANVIVVNGAGLEEFMEDILHDTDPIDSSIGIEIIECDDPHEQDSHIWLSPRNAMVMVRNISDSLCTRYPEFSDTFEANREGLLADLNMLQSYGETNLKELSCRDIITFHDGFAYFAECFDLHIVKAVEEESGAEASAAELKELIGIVREYGLPAIFTETNGSVSAADVIARETGAAVYTLDMAMSGDSYFDAMYHNIDTIKEALG